MGKTYRPIEQFNGDLCVVGRGWCESLKAVEVGEMPHEAWYRWEHTYSQFEPRLNGVNIHNSYYIDYANDIAADFTCDFTESGEPTGIPKDKFSLLVFEFLPGPCFDPGKHTIENAIRVVRSEGRIAVHTRNEVVEKAKQLMSAAGLNPQIRTIKKKLIFPEWVMKAMSKEAQANDADPPDTNEDNEEFTCVEAVVGNKH